MRDRQGQHLPGQEGPGPEGRERQCRRGRQLLRQGERPRARQLRSQGHRARNRLHHLPGGELTEAARRLTFGDYESFFVASAGASAAILGLLVVAVSIVNSDDDDSKTRERRTVLAGSAFLALVDIFFVSIVALTGGAVLFGVSSLAMALVGLGATSRLMPRAARAGNFARGFPTR